MLKYFLTFLTIICSLMADAQVCQGNFGNNIFDSGDFGRGTTQILPLNPGLAPGYNYTNTLPPADGFYTIVNKLNQSQIYPDWLPISDNSSSDIGYMMVINASFEPGLFYEQTITGLCDDVLYEFSADIFNLIAAFSTDRIDPNVSFLLNDQVIFTTGRVPKNQRWNTYGFTFNTAPGQTTLKLSLRNNAPGGLGNDLALDNITFRPCGATARILPATVANICEDGQPINIFATVEGAAFEDVFVQWQQSLDGGFNWENIDDEINESFRFSSLRAGDYYYRYLLADTKEKLDNPKCRTISNTKVVRVIPKFVSVKDSICSGLISKIGDQEYTTTGTYTDTLRNVVGCDSIVTLDLAIVEEELTGNFTVTEPSCIDASDGSIIVESLSNPGPYVILIDDIRFGEPGNLRNKAAGEFQYNITDRYGCVLDTLIALEDPPPFTVDLGPDQNLILGENLEVDLTASDSVVSYLWEPGIIDCQPPCETINVLLTRTDTLSVVATSVKGCTATDRIIVNIDGTVELTIPNVFTPNNDGMNDYFTIFNTAELSAVQTISSLSVIDRTGRLMFSRESFTAGIARLGWDGSINGTEAPSGVYYYSATLTLINGEQVTYTGNVSLLR